MWEIFLVVALITNIVRFVRGGGRSSWGRLEGDVPDAPADAEPLLVTRLDDNGLATYSVMYLRPEAAAS